MGDGTLSTMSQYNRSPVPDVVMSCMFKFASPLSGSKPFAGLGLIGSGAKETDETIHRDRRKLHDDVNLSPRKSCGFLSSCCHVTRRVRGERSASAFKITGYSGRSPRLEYV